MVSTGVRTKPTYVLIYIYIYLCTCFMMYFAQGSLEVKLPTIRTDEKAEVGRVRAEKSRREKIGEEKE